MTFDMTAGSMAGMSIEMKTDMEFYDFGATQNIEIPANADTVDINEVPALKVALAKQAATS